VQTGSSSVASGHSGGVYLHGALDGPRWSRGGRTFLVRACLYPRHLAHCTVMGRVILVGVSTVMAFIVFGCGSSNSTGTGTPASGGSSGAGGVVASGGSTSTGGATGTGGNTGAGGSKGSGGASSGGSTGSGGTSGAGGSGSGGSAGVSPGKATVEFTVTGGPYCMTMQCAVGPSIDITDASGHSISGVTSSCTDFSCSTCQPSPCPGYYCPPPSGVVVTGATMEWNGSYYAKSTCGTGTSCVESIFAKPGKYTATMCATPGKLAGPNGGIQQCVTSGPAKCASVEFDFPSSTVVTGTVGP
jgi:hypothetical protein